MASPYEKIVDMIKQLDLQDDGIAMNQKIKSIEQDFCNVVLDENMLSESMEYINQRVLYDKDASLKFALLFSSRNFDSLAMNETKVRYKMLNILQNNFLNADQFRQENKEKFYNSVTLLGEYYHRVRLADGSPIAILGESLLGLLTQELNDQNKHTPQNIDLKLAKLILSQVTLNGSIMRSAHREELNTLLYHIRRNMIEIPDLNPAVKALLLMTLDLYYSNFSNLGELLEEMYTKYLVEEDKLSQESSVLENESEDHDSEPKKKWSEQVCEDAAYEASSNGDCCDSFNQDHQNPNSLENNISVAENSSRTSNYNNRYNSGYDDDRHSVRSEGGSIRLYNVKDRLKQGYRNNNNQNNNWDRKYHTYDRNRRSNSRNGNQYDNSNNHNKNNRMYNRPPRFNNNNNNRGGEYWRGGQDNFNRGGGNNHNSKNNGSRPPRNNYDNYNGRSVSPEGNKNYNRGYNRNNNQQRQQPRNFANSRNNRYSSHSSLASDTGTWERRGRRRNSRGKSEEFFSRDDPRKQQDEREGYDVNNEIVRNARYTSNYLQSLAKK